MLQFALVQFEWCLFYSAQKLNGMENLQDQMSKADMESFALPVPHLPLPPQPLYFWEILASSYRSQENNVEVLNSKSM